MRAVDDWFNLVPGVAARCELTGTDPRLGVAGAPALAGGAAAVTVTPYLAGAQTVTASALTAGGSTTNQRARFEVAPARTRSCC